MSDLEKHIDLIDKALNGLLNQTETAAYQDKLRNDPAFATLAQDMELMRKALVIKNNVAKLKTLEKSLPPVEQHKEDRPDEYGKDQAGSSIQRRMPKWAAAASIVLLLSVGSYFFLESNPGSEDLFTSNFEVYPNLETERIRTQAPGATATATTPEQNAYAAYDAKNYEAAINAFLLFVDQNKNPKDYFFLGNAYLANNNLTEAIATFRKITDRPSEYKDRANWYLALAYLKSGKPELAKTTLELMAENTVAKSYREKAEQLLEELD